MEKKFVFFKIGAEVQFVRRSGAPAHGRVDGNDVLSNGVWVSVNTAPHGENRDIVKVRPSQLVLVSEMQS